MVRGGAGGGVGGVELLRGCGRCGGVSVRPEIRWGARDGGRRAGRGAGDALGRRDRETVARLVRARRGGMIMISATPLDTDSRVHLAETLAAAGLPIADLDQPGRSFFRFDADATVGFGGLEGEGADRLLRRSEEHTSELQSLMRISYAVFCLKKKKQKK